MNQPIDVNDFALLSKDEWLTTLLSELKGATFESLHWMHPDLGPIAPVFSRQEAPTPLPMPPRSYRSPAGRWEITQSYRLSHETNEQVIRGLRDGVSGLELSLGFAEPDRTMVENLTAGVFLNMVALRVSGGALKARQHAFMFLAEQHIDVAAEFTGCIGHDPITEHLCGHPPCEVAKSLTEHIGYIRTAGAKMRTVSVDAAKIGETGGSDALELAYALHVGQRYLEHLLNAGVTVDDAAPLFDFTLSAGQSYFVTIAKFRALRYMWAKVIAECKPQHACSLVTWIHGRTSQRNFSANDVHNNLLRSVTSAMGALTGGCDSLEVLPYTPWDVSDDALRLARNVHHLLHEEAWLDATTDAGGGSYYIEYLTQRLIDRAQSYCADFDAKGSLEQTAGHHHLLQTLHAHRAALKADFTSKKISVIGANLFAPQNSVEEPEIIAETNNQLPPFILAAASHQTENA